MRASWFWMAQLISKAFLWTQHPVGPGSHSPSLQSGNTSRVSSPSQSSPAPSISPSSSLSPIPSQAWLPSLTWILSPAQILLTGYCPQPRYSLQPGHPSTVAAFPALDPLPVQIPPWPLQVKSEAPVCAHPILESGSSSLKLSAIVVERAMRGSFFCREGRTGCEHECLCLPTGPPFSLPELMMCLLGAELHRGAGRGGWGAGNPGGSQSGERGSRMVTRHGKGDLSLGPSTEHPPL